ncbi:hypothetical protein [Rathayibacter festucae]|uniref:Uncharacterized protein n=1 Tax=Rathayibacter festucae DSM 15932 TaxID=1328866 RepID=A0A3T0SWR9_9MICO|nr:hypothetical protein [Rathayibacter festucae]AZZ50836.1 hypothetical protein C1I64_01370 [Rathayibacter festucae DSM 15932]
MSRAISVVILNSSHGKPIDVVHVLEMIDRQVRPTVEIVVTGGIASAPDFGRRLSSTWARRSASESLLYDPKPK